MEQKPSNIAGYSTTSLAKKLGLKAGIEVLAMNAPTGYRALLEPLPADVRFVSAATASTTLVHVFETKRERLAKTLASLRGHGGLVGPKARGPRSPTLNAGKCRPAQNHRATAAAAPALMLYLPRILIIRDLIK
jgi:hypothetical protein